MKQLFAFSILIFSLKTLAGSISGGGFPGPVKQPSENFVYSCQIHYNQQINADHGDSCYAGFVAETTFKKRSSVSSTGGLEGDKFDDLNFKKEFSHGPCGESPLSKENAFVSLSVAGDNDSATTSLVVSVGLPGENEPWGRGATTVPYNIGSVEASTQVGSAAMILSVTAKCVKSVK